MNKKKLFIIASILAAIGLVVMLFMLPKPKTNNSAKPISTETSTSNKNDKKDDKKEDKKDSKKDDKKEDKKEDTSTTSETPATPTTGTTTTETQNNNNSSSVTNTPTTTNTTPSQPEPQPIYQTIHHDEVGHWETQVIQEEWDQPIYERKIIGNQTGTIYSNVDEFAFNTNGDGSYHVGDVQVGTTHHDAVTQEVWVVDQAAWDQTVIVGYR